MHYGIKTCITRNAVGFDLVSSAKQKKTPTKNLMNIEIHIYRERAWGGRVSIGNFLLLQLQFKWLSKIRIRKNEKVVITK